MEKNQHGERMKYLLIIIVLSLSACGDPAAPPPSANFDIITSCSGMAHKALPYRYECK
jgi:hypothetical protein